MNFNNISKQPSETNNADQLLPRRNSTDNHTQTTRTTRSSTKFEPTTEIALVSTYAIQDIIETLCCPVCYKSKVRCSNWRHIAGGFTFCLICSSPQCQFQKICNSSPKVESNSRLYAVAIRFVGAWQFAGLTFEPMEFIFTLSGGMPPLTRMAYNRLAHQTSDAITLITDVDLLSERKQMKGKPECALTFDGTYAQRGHHANRITALAINPENKHTVWRKHAHRDLGTSRLTKKIPLRTYEGTALTAELDLMKDMIGDFKAEGNPITHLTVDGDQKCV